MFRIISFVLVSVLSFSVFAKSRTLPRKSVTDKNQTQYAEPVQSSHSSTTIFQPADIFEGSGKGELFLDFTNAQIEIGNGGSNIMLSGMYTYLIKEQVQVGAQVSLGSTSIKGGYSASTTRVFGLGVYNFSPSISDSYFAFGGLGIAPTYATGLKGSDTKFGFLIGAGKRFPLMAKLHYSPIVTLEKIGDSDPLLTIKTINLSVIF